jgi:iron complex outermembrane receptor protein
VTDRWTLSGWYAWFDLDIVEDAPGAINPILDEGFDPRNQAHLRSHLDLPRQFDLDIALNYVSRLSNPRIPDYLRADLGVSWSLNDALELKVGGRNLLDSRHPEFGAEIFAVTSEVPRTFYGVITWRF